MSGGGPLPLISGLLVGTWIWREEIINGAPNGVAVWVRSGVVKATGEASNFICSLSRPEDEERKKGQEGKRVKKKDGENK